MNIAFQGEHGAYSELALIRHFGRDVRAMGFDGFEEVFEAVVDGRVVLRVPAERVYAADGAELHPEVRTLLRALASISQRHGEAYIAVTEAGSTPRR